MDQFDRNSIGWLSRNLQNAATWVTGNKEETELHLLRIDNIASQELDSSAITLSTQNFQPEYKDGFTYVFPGQYHCVKNMRVNYVYGA
jgi:hypothetical protein